MASERYRFGGFELDVAAHRLTRDGPPIQLQPKPMIGIERAASHQWERVRALRLAALLDTPDAFGSVWADEAYLPARDSVSNAEIASGTLSTPPGDSTPQPPEFWQGRLQSGSVTLVATMDGRDAGLCVVSDSDHGPGVAGLYSMWVAPEARGRGVGDALLEAALVAAPERGASRLVLDVGDFNHAAIALYARWGFAPTGRVGSLPPPRQQIAEHERARDLDPVEHHGDHLGGDAPRFDEDSPDEPRTD